MGNRNLTLKSVLGLDTKGFQKGVRIAQSSLNSLRMKFMSFAATLGAGLGLSDFAKTLMDTAKQMDKSQTTLKNVSNGYEQYAENQKYLIGLSNKYAQNILVLTDNFAKFHASSDQANVSLEDQKKIFESLTRASAFYNLTADETNGIFLAVTQMMSKGKVASEELRRQLAERLPSAFGLMAKALGMTTQELDKALRDGKVMAADALPKLADELNKVTQNLNVDTIQGWTNRLKNAIVDMTKNLHLDKLLKNVIKGTTSAVKYITDNFETIKTSAIALVSALVGSNIMGKFGREIKKSSGQISREIKQDLKTADSIYKEYMAKATPEIMGQRRYDNFKQTGPFRDDGKLKQFPFIGQLYANDDLATYKKRIAVFKELNQLAEQYNAIIDDTNRKQGRLNKVTNALKNIGNSIWTTIKGIASTIASGAIFYALSAIAQKLIRIKKEAKEAAEYFDKMKEEHEATSNSINSSDTPYEPLMKDIKDNYSKNVENLDEKERNRILKERVSIIKSINRELGLEGDKQFTIDSSLEDMTATLQKQIDILKKRQQLEASKNTKAEAHNEIENLMKENRNLYEQINSANADINNPSIDIVSKGVAKQKKKDAERKLANNRVKRNNADKIIEDMNGLIAKYEKELSDLGEIVEQENGNLKTEDISEYSTARKEYQKKLNILNDKLNDNIISEEEYNKALQSLVMSTLDTLYEMAQGENGIKVGSDAFSKALLDKARSFGEVSIKPIENLMNEFKDARTELRNKFNGGALDSKGYEEAMSELVEETFNALAGMGALSGELTEFAKFIKDLHNRFKNKSKKDLEYEFKQDMPKLEKRDTTFDYSKSDSDIKYEQAEIWQNQVDELQRKMDEIKNDSNLDGMFDDVNKQLTEAIKNAKDFKTAADLSKIKEDVKDLRKSAFSSVSDGVDSIATVIDRLTDDMEKLNNPEVEGWERIQIILNSIFQTFDGIIQAVEMFTELEKIMNQLTAAEKAQQAVEAAGTATSLAGSASKVAAGQAEALSNGTASASKLPFPANLAAIAASIAAITAIFATFPKFANGGLVGGHSMTGDKLLARVNSGEMILNQGQQANLLNQLNSGNNVQFKIKGQDLVGVLNNYTKKVSK